MVLSMTTLIGYGVAYVCIGVIIGFMFAVAGSYGYEPREDNFYEMEEENEVSKKEKIKRQKNRN